MPFTLPTRFIVLLPSSTLDFLLNKIFLLVACGVSRDFHFYQMCLIVCCKLLHYCVLVLFLLQSQVSFYLWDTTNSNILIDACISEHALTAKATLACFKLPQTNKKKWMSQILFQTGCRNVASFENSSESNWWMGIIVISVVIQIPILGGVCVPVCGSTLTYSWLLNQHLKVFTVQTKESL